LVVDSDFFFVEFLSELLALKGYEVSKAYDGKEGMARLEENDFAMIFVDMIMPKVDGWQLIKYIGMKFPRRRFPVIALSATIIEQLDQLNEIAADYFIAKGSIAKMREQLNGFIDDIQANRCLPTTNHVQLLTVDNLFPRRESAQLIENLRFQQAIVESIGMGVIVVDKDGRVLSVNRQTLAIIHKSAVETLNRPLPELFPESERRAIVDGLRSSSRQQTPCDLNVAINAQVVRLIITLLDVAGKVMGWVVALEATAFDTEP
jgi:CheY-like chemotaxis protein